MTRDKRQAATNGPSNQDRDRREGTQNPKQRTKRTENENNPKVKQNSMTNYQTPTNGLMQPEEVDHKSLHHYQKSLLIAVGFEPTPSRTSALSWRLRPLGQATGLTGHSAGRAGP